MSSALSICILFVSPMQSVNRAQVLNTNSTSLLFPAGGGTSVFGIVLLK